MTLKRTTRIINSILWLAYLIALPGLSAPAVALPTDTAFPIEIASDTAEFNDKTGTVKHIGHVLMTQGSRHLTADSLLIERNQTQKIQKMVARGKPAYFRLQPELNKPILHARAEQLEFFPQTQQLMLTTNAEVSQDDHIIRGDRLVYRLDRKSLMSLLSNGKRTTVVIPAKSHQRQPETENRP